MENTLKNNNLINLSKTEMNNLNGGFVITGTMIATGVGLVGAGYAAGKWFKNNFLK